VVRKVRAGHLTDGRHAPCSFSVPPSSPQGGIPDLPPLKIRCAGVAPGHSSAPALSRRLHFPFAALRQGRRRPFPLPHGPAPPLLFFARRFIPADFVMSLAAVRKCRAGLPGLSCRLHIQHRPRRRGRHGPCISSMWLASPPVRHVLCTFRLFPSPAYRRKPGLGHVAYPLNYRRASDQGIYEDVGGVAVAGVAPRSRSSPALCTAATPVSPRPPSRLQSPVGAAFRGRPVGD